jgi:threonylcarbamoyladenosine tRNA methylthiotransferase MtaB
MAALKARLVTLGCKVNQYETQYVKEMLELAGYVEAGEGESASLCVVNTCTVTHEGDAKSRQAIRRLASENAGAPVVVMGCYATRAPETVARLPGVVRVIADKSKLAEELAPFGVREVPEGISRFDGHQRAFVKVQDGCLLNCSYCIIPSVRPIVRSRPVDEVAAEVARLVEAGYPEVVLTGVHLGHYGIDLSRGRPRSEWVRLWDLLNRLAALPGDFRIRLSSLEAAEARDGLTEVMARRSDRICPHLHLCLQSGSDRILAAMKRRYRVAGFLERVRRLRRDIDALALTTDIIVGFPGEMDEDFEETMRVAREAAFSRIHVFSYSPREGTEAAKGRDDVPAAVKAERRRRLEQLSREQAQRFAGGLVGRVLDVLVEGADDGRPGHSRGTSCRYVPVTFPGHAPALVRRRVPVRAVAAVDGVIIGEPAGEPGARAALSRWGLPVVT